MEFFSMINKLLKRSAESRRRNLRIRTYAVLPLNEECGILEWVDNTHPFRGILRTIYEAKNLTVRRQEVNFPPLPHACFFSPFLGFFVTQRWPLDALGLCSSNRSIRTRARTASRLIGPCFWKFSSPSTHRCSMSGF